MQVVQVFFYILLLQQVYNLTALIVILNAHDSNACCQSVIAVEEAVKGSSLRQMDRIYRLAFTLFDGVDDGIQSCKVLNAFHVNVVLLYNRVIQHPELSQRRILVGRNCVYLLFDGSASPQVFGDEIIQLRCLRLYQVCDISKCVQVNELGVVCIIYKHQVEILTGVNDVVHLGSPVSPACDLNIESYADLLFCIVADLCDGLIEIIGRCSADAPPDQSRHFTIVCLRSIGGSFVIRSFCNGCVSSTIVCCCGCCVSAACQHTGCHSRNETQRKKLVYVLLFHTFLLLCTFAHLIPSREYF